MSERKMTNDHAETTVLPEHLRPDRIDALAGAAAEAQVRYQEYLRLLDELPVLVDVVSESSRIAIKDFRSGQRRDDRKAPREDAAQLREQHDRELDRHYDEYVTIGGALASTKRAEPRRSGGQKKRAKRAKRSARSKA